MGNVRRVLYFPQAFLKGEEKIPRKQSATCLKPSPITCSSKHAEGQGGCVENAILALKREN